MSAKNVIQNLEDSELIRIFLDFVQTYHLQYEKIDKEISYKCHQATWILASTKATGYGRTESEAYKHALRNLLQILIQDPPYTQFFTNLLTSTSSSGSKNQPNTAITNSNYSKPGQTNSVSMNNNTNNLRSQGQNLNNKQKPVTPATNSNIQNIGNSSNNKSPLYSHLSASLASNSSASNVAIINKRQLKTQAVECEQQYLQASNNVTMKGGKYETTNKLALANNGYKNMGSYQPYSQFQYSQNSSTNKKQTNSKANLNTSYEHSGQNSQNSIIMHKQMHLDQTGVNSSTKNISSANHVNYQQELKQALIKNKILLQELSSINKQNQMLKAKLQSGVVKNNSSLSNLNSNIGSNHFTNNYSNANINSQINYPSSNKGMRLSIGGNQNNTSVSYLQQGHNKTCSHTNISLNTSTNGLATNLNILNSQNLNTTNSTTKNNSNAMTATIIPSAASFTIVRDTNQNKQNAQNPSSFEDDDRSPKMMSNEETKPRPSMSSNTKSKIQVPKLKLQILPNYHKKVEKSLNDSLLAVYEQKHGVTNSSGCGSSDITGVSSMMGGININVSANNFKKVM